MNLGEVLHDARTSVGISIEDLASAISIRTGLLIEMERNNFSHCGGDIYARGHLRNIAPKLGLDVDQLINQYNEEHSIESRSINEMLVENSVTRVPHEKKNISWKVPAAFSLIAVAVFALVQIIVTNVNSDAPVKSPVAASSAPSAPASPVAIASASPDVSTSVAPTGNGVTLTIEATRGNSLIDIVVDGKHVEKGSIFQGESKSFEATTSISIFLSNPAGLDVTVNDKLLSPLGGENQEVRRTFR